MKFTSNKCLFRRRKDALPMGIVLTQIVLILYSCFSFEEVILITIINIYIAFFFEITQSVSNISNFILSKNISRVIKVLTHIVLILCALSYFKEKRYINMYYYYYNTHIVVHFLIFNLSWFSLNIDHLDNIVSSIMTSYIKKRPDEMY